MGVATLLIGLVGLAFSAVTLWVLLWQNFWKGPQIVAHIARLSMSVPEGLYLLVVQPLPDGDFTVLEISSDDMEFAPVVTGRDEYGGETFPEPTTYLRSIPVDMRLNPDHRDPLRFRFWARRCSHWRKESSPSKATLLIDMASHNRARIKKAITHTPTS